jgi:hypothetical protein
MKPREMPTPLMNIRPIWPEKLPTASQSASHQTAVNVATHAQAHTPLEHGHPNPQPSRTGYTSGQAGSRVTSHDQAGRQAGTRHAAIRRKASLHACVALRTFADSVVLTREPGVAWFEAAVSDL